MFPRLHIHNWLPHFQAAMQHHGLAAVFVVLFLENFGLPLPGELALLYAGFEVHRLGFFGLPQLILVSSIATILGECGGYGIARYAGDWMRRVLRFDQKRHAYVESYFRRYGAATLLLARFIAGLRILAGPFAGLYHMAWRPFLTFNILGGILWTGAIATAGYSLGSDWRRLGHWLARADLLLLIAAVIVVGMALRRLRRNP